MNDRPLTPAEKDAVLYAGTGKTELLKAHLIKSGLGAGWISPDQSCSLLTTAATRDNAETLQFLLENGADPKWKGSYGCALDVAVKWNKRLSAMTLLPVTDLAALEVSRAQLNEVLKEPAPPLLIGEGHSTPVVLSRAAAAASHCSALRNPVAPPFEDSLAFRACTSISNFRGEALEVDLLEMGRLVVGKDGIEIGNPLGDVPITVPLLGGNYRLLSLDPEINRLKPSVEVRARLSIGWPTLYMLERLDAPDAAVRWGERINSGSESRILAFMRSGRWDELAELLESNDRLWNAMVDLPTNKDAEDVWSPLGFRLNAGVPGDGIVVCTQADGFIWPGYDASGNLVSVLCHFY